MLIQRERVSSERAAAISYHDNLHDSNEALDSEVQPVVEYALEHVPFAFHEFSGIDGVEDLHEHENIEENGEMVAVCVIPLKMVEFTVGRNLENYISVENHHCEHHNLEHGLSDDVHGHHRSENASFGFLIGSTLQQFVTGRLGGQREGGEGVHYEIDPEHLNGIQRRVLQHDSSNQGHEDCDHIGRQLELDELPYAVVDVSSVFDGRYYRGERVVEENDIRSVLGDVCASLAHCEAYMRLF